VSDASHDAPAVPSDAEVAAAAAAHPLWYHTLELRPGVVTRGTFDLRGVVDRLPWPDVTGKRCLDIGTYDGQLAFELERRGAREVVATDIADQTLWDWPPRRRAVGPTQLAEFAGPDKGAGFVIARDALGSRVERIDLSIYDLSPDRVGTFDVVVCGNLLLHLRNPFGALEAVRSVTTGQFLSFEQIRLSLSWRHRRRAIFDLERDETFSQWLVPNRAAHVAMIERAGFDVDRVVAPLPQRFGPAHPPTRGGLRWSALALVRRLGLGEEGLPSSAVLGHPAI